MKGFKIQIFTDQYQPINFKTNLINIYDQKLKHDTMFETKQDAYFLLFSLYIVNLKLIDLYHPVLK